MSADLGPLDKATHARVFAESILPESRLDHVVAQNSPRAIITAGQPGAGKGNLVEAANAELGGSAVVIDPDRLRKYHPDIKQLREAHPYTWSIDTNRDAGRWAGKLRDAAIEGRRNIIFDTTLAKADPVIKQIREMQAQGYQMEIRVVAAHRLESELGIDRRFTNQLDREGHGRHVPREYHDLAYDALPANLDKVLEQTGARIRIYSREGIELYDSHTSPLKPSPVLEQARDARMVDPAITRDVSKKFQKQQSWHEALPESLERKAQVSIVTARNLPPQHSALKVEESVKRSAGEAIGIDRTVRIEPAASRATLGLNVIGTAALAYDAYASAQDAARLLEQDNLTGAQSQLLHFGARNLGMAGGAALGASLGAAAGVESGPGLLVTGLAGGVIGAFGGDKIAQVLDEARIYSQRGSDGNLWQLDPRQPDQGWTRLARPGEFGPQGPPDAAAGGPDFRNLVLHADARLSDELNHKASSVAVQLALAHPPQPQDPHAQPASLASTGRPGIDQPGHPGHALFQQAQAGMRALDAEIGRASDHHTDNMAACLAVSAHGLGLTRIDHVAMGADNQKIWAVEGKPGRTFSKVAGASIEGAMVPVQQTSQLWDQAQQQGQAEPQRPAAETLAQPQKQMPGPGMRR